MITAIKLLTNLSFVGERKKKKKNIELKITDEAAYI